MNLFLFTLLSYFHKKHEKVKSIFMHLQYVALIIVFITNSKYLLCNILSFVLGVTFPKNFLTIAKTILKRLFRVYAHVYHAHFRDIINLNEEPHLNTSFKHFIYFVQEFSLIEKRELAPLQELIDKLMHEAWRTVWTIKFINHCSADVV